jgi:hypothetical protein
MANEEFGEISNEKSKPSDADFGVAAKNKEENNLAELIKKNIRWSQLIYEQNRKIRRSMLLAAIASWLRVLLIAIPLILAIIFLPPLIQNLLNQYSSVLSNVNSVSSETDSLTNQIKSIINSMQK